MTPEKSILIPFDEVLSNAKGFFIKKKGQDGYFSTNQHLSGIGDNGERACAPAMNGQGVIKPPMAPPCSKDGQSYAGVHEDKDNFPSYLQRAWEQGLFTSELNKQRPNGSVQ